VAPRRIEVYSARLRLWPFALVFGKAWTDCPDDRGHRHHTAFHATIKTDFKDSTDAENYLSSCKRRPTLAS
jgi:hypothetical protein